MSKSTANDQTSYLNWRLTSAKYSRFTSESTAKVDYTGTYYYRTPGDINLAKVIVGKQNLLKSALLEADRKYGDMLKRLAD